MGRKRKKDKDLPFERWTRNGGKIYYIVPEADSEKWDNKKWFPLGKTVQEALRTWYDRVDPESKSDIQTMGQLFDRYLAEYTPTVRPNTQNVHISSIKKLRPVFGDIKVTEFKTAWAYKIYDKIEKKHGTSAAGSTINTLSGIFTKAIEWGLIENHMHPTRGLKIKKTSNARDRYVEDWEVEEFCKVCPAWLKNYVIIKLCTGLDKSTLLRIKLNDITESGFYVARVKTKGKRNLRKWSKTLFAAVESAKKNRLNQESEWLFCNKKGEKLFTEEGRTSKFDFYWKTAMEKALEKTELKARFTDHDLRRKASSDMDDDESAARLLDHAPGSSMTRKHYRVKLEEVESRELNLEILS